MSVKPLKRLFIIVSLNYLLIDNLQLHCSVMLSLNRWKDGSIPYVRNHLEYCGGVFEISDPTLSRHRWEGYITRQTTYA